MKTREDELKEKIIHGTNMFDKGKIQGYEKGYIKGIAEGKAQEQERIIKIIEEFKLQYEQTITKFISTLEESKC